MLGTKMTEQGKKQERAKFHVAFPWQKNGDNNTNQNLPWKIFILQYRIF